VQVQVMVAQTRDDGPAAAVEHFLAGQPVKRGRYLHDDPVAHPDVRAAAAVKLAIAQQQAAQ
jgi:hypothetical protein